jgi:hypothetical protein
MSDAATLKRTRSIRFSALANRRLQAKAARAGKTVSDIVRQMIEAELESEEQTAGEWILSVARARPQRRPIPPQRLAFRQAYKRQHG